MRLLITERMKEKEYKEQNKYLYYIERESTVLNPYERYSKRERTMDRQR